MSMETPSTARTGPRLEKYSTPRLRIERSGSASEGPPRLGCGLAENWGRAVSLSADLGVGEGISDLPLRAKSRIRDLVDRVIHHRQSERYQRDAETGRHDRPPGSRHQSSVVGRPVEIGAPGDDARIAKTDEFEAGQRPDRVDRRSEHPRDNDRKHIG